MAPRLSDRSGRRRRDELIARLVAVPAVRLRGIAAGLHAVLDLPGDGPSEDEVIARLKQLEAGGATNILLVDPNASVGNLRAFAREVMPAFRPARAVAAAE